MPHEFYDLLNKGTANAKEKLAFEITMQLPLYETGGLELYGHTEAKHLPYTSCIFPIRQI